MPIDISDVPYLRNSVMQGLVERNKTPRKFLFTNLFGTGVNSESENLVWESEVGSFGMTPFVAPGNPSPITTMTGVFPCSAKAAYWREKISFGEHFLNNMRKPGTRDVTMAAKEKINKETTRLGYRSDARLEWMYAQMICNGSFSYFTEGGKSAVVDYQIPDLHKITLPDNRKWKTGADADILEDMYSLKLLLSNNTDGEFGESPSLYALCTTEVLNLMVMDPGIRQLMKSTDYGQSFGAGNLFTNSVPTLQKLLGLSNLTVYDGRYQIRTKLIGNVIANSTVDIPVDEVRDFTVGDKLRLIDTEKNGSFEERAITDVNAAAGVITVASAYTKTYRPKFTIVETWKKFIPTNKMIFFLSDIEGTPTADCFKAPYGLDRTYGKSIDQNLEWDPDILWVRCQNAGLPYLKNRDAVIHLTVQ